MRPYIDLYTDGHVHTTLCHHATGTMEEYVAAALGKGLKRLIFLEHLEKGVEYFESTWLNEVDFEYYFSEGKRLKQLYDGKIEVCIGVEVGYNPGEVDTILAFLARYSWDCVGLSYHFIEDNGRHINLLSRKQANWDEISRIGVSNVLGRYFEGLISAVQQIPAHLLCHLDAALRFHPDVYLNKKHQEQIFLLLDLIEQQKMVLEINTSGFAHRGTPYPQEWIVKKAIEKNLSFRLGSDAHHPSDVGQYFSRVPEYLNSIL